ncbi:MAG: S49 family peptidase, partial [Candidatus Neomarinimicrobiota bacterium]
GAYLVALGANKIVANPGSITGSIGVIIDFPIVVNLMKKLGVEMKVVKSGEYKDVGSPFKELGESDRAHLKNVVDDLQSQFVDVVVNERHLPKNDLLKIADGRIFTGSQAVQLGLIDTLGTLEDAIMLTGKLAGMVQKPETVILKKKKKSLLDLLFSDVEEVASMTTQTPAIEYLWK